jgi:hypothetical protein
LRFIRLLVATLLGVAACTGSVEKTSTPNEFVDAACADLSAWSTAVGSAFEDVQNLRQFGTSGDPVAEEGLLRTLVDSLRAAEVATAQLAKGISARGAPNITDGEAIKNSILDTLDRLRELLHTTRRDVDAFKLSTATKEQTDALRLKIDELTTNVGETFARLAPLNQNNELRAAFLGSASCQGLSSSFGSS